MAVRAKKKKATRRREPKSAPAKGSAREVAKRWVDENALRVAAAAAVPIPVPGAHTLLSTAIEAYMIASVAKIYGRALSVGEAVALIPALGATIAVGTAASAVAGELVGWIPVVGWVAKGAASGATALAVGKAAVAYFEAMQPGQKSAVVKMTSVRDFVRDVFEKLRPAKTR